MHCDLNLPTVGSLDNHIHFFNEKQPCVQVRELLHLKLSIIDESRLERLRATKSDVEEACEPCQLLDPDEEGDENIDIL